ncbi:GQ67_00651T0 [Komagataella phaffii]|nr:GQ67_00651T0 [Komagataella phaffii]AOA67657.1 GQ68_00737T0 [Komagataella phaffii GS115]
MGLASSKIMDSLAEGTNCRLLCVIFFLFLFLITNFTVDREEVDRLRKRFMKLDTDGSGTIDKKEFLSIPGVNTNPLAERLLDLFDEDGGGDIDFQEFIIGLSTFSSRSSITDKLSFAFKIYDIDRDGFISNGELFIILKTMVGGNLKDEELQQIVDRTLMENDLDGDGKLSFDEFKSAVDHTSIVNKFTLNLGI